MNKNRYFAVIVMFSVLAAIPAEGSDRRHSVHGHSWAPLALGVTLEAADQANPGEGKILYYQDPMHPWYHSDKPGIAPDCGMKLVPVYASEGPALPPGSIDIRPARQKLMGITTARAEYRAIDQTVRAYGQVALDETRLVHVHVRTSGWIRKVFADYTWQHVKQGDPLFTFYRPDLLATEQEYLLALRARDSLAGSSFQEIVTAGTSLLEAARRRLELWDLRRFRPSRLRASPVTI